MWNVQSFLARTMTVRVTRAHWKGTFVPAFHIFPFPNAAISQKVQHETPQHAAVVNAAERIQKIQEVLKTADVATERVTWVGLKDDLWYLSNMMENQPQIVSVPKIHQIQTNRIYFLFAVFFCCPSTQNGEQPPLNSHGCFREFTTNSWPNWTWIRWVAQIFLGTFILSVQ